MKHAIAYVLESVLFFASLWGWLWTRNPILGVVMFLSLVLLVQE